MAPLTVRGPIHLAVASPQEVVQRGITSMLADHPERVVVIQLASVRAKAPNVDVILYDALSIQSDGGATLAHLVQHSQAEVLLLSRDLRPDLRARAQAMGCARWVSMSSTTAELISAVESAHRGQAPLQPPAGAGGDVGLTGREHDVLTLITQGLSNEEIARRLYLAPDTLKSHIRSAYKRIGVATRPQAVAWAMQNGIAPGRPQPRG